jgi:hypothetical protein
MTATEQFTAAATLLRGTPHKFSVKSTMLTYEGSVDPLVGIVVAKLAVDAGVVKVSFDTLLNKTAYYIKSSAPLPGVDASKWYKADPEKVTSPTGPTLGGLSDPTGLRTLVKAVASVEKVSDRQVKGTFDLTKTDGWGPVDASAVKALGDKAKAVPFEASIDDRGRLTTLTVTAPAGATGGADKVTINYSDFGTAVKLTEPAASEVVEAPDQLYALLNEV